MGGHEAALALHLAQLGDVLEGEHGADGPALAVDDRRGRIAHRDRVAVARLQHPLARELDVAPLGETPRHRVEQHGVGVGVDDLEDVAQVLAVGLVDRPAGQPLGGRVHVVDHAAHVGADDAVADRGERDLGALLLLEQRLLGELAVGDVDRDAEQARRPARALAHDLAALGEPAGLAVAQHQAMLDEVVAVVVERGLERALEPGQVLGVDQREELAARDGVLRTEVQQVAGVRRVADAVGGDVPVPDHDVAGLLGELKPLLARAQRLLGQLALGDVEGGAEAGELAAVLDRGERELDPALAAVGQPQSGLAAARRGVAPAQPLLPALEDQPPGLLVGEVERRAGEQRLARRPGQPFHGAVDPKEAFAVVDEDAERGRSGDHSQPVGALLEVLDREPLERLVVAREGARQLAHRVERGAVVGVAQRRQSSARSGCDQRRRAAHS